MNDLQARKKSCRLINNAGKGCFTRNGVENDIFQQTNKQKMEKYSFTSFTTKHREIMVQ